MLFIISVTICLLSCFFLTTTKNIVNSCLFFLGAMLSLAGFYFTLETHFLALAQLIYTFTAISFIFLTIKISGGNEQKGLMGNSKTFLVSLVITLIATLLLLQILKVSNLKQNYYLSIALMLFTVGIFNILSRKNMLAILMGTQLIIHAAALNFVAYSKFSLKNVEGATFTFAIILASIAEIVVALALVNRFFLIKKSINIDDATLLKN